eukprot:3170540-Heterocapsa_arctica.AAC.1
MHEHAIATSCRSLARLLSGHAVAASLCPFNYFDSEAPWLRPPGKAQEELWHRDGFGTCSPRRQRGESCQ